MSINDGHQLVATGKGMKAISCSRWQELMDGMKFHAKLAEVSGSMTEFRLLNGAPPVVRKAINIFTLVIVDTTELMIQ
jgi:hypothetical protein